MIPNHNQKYIEILTNSFKNNFGKRIIFLGLHGSSRHSSLEPNYTSDIDLELILNTVKPEDMETVKEIISTVSVKVECQIRSIYEITDTHSLIYKTEYKIFMYHAYANSITLIGKNIYKNLLGEFTNKQYKDSLLINIQLAWKDIRKYFLANKEPTEINKLVEVFLFDVLLYINQIDYRDLDKKKIFEMKRYNVYEISSNFFSSILNTDEKAFLLQYQKNHSAKIFDIKIIVCLEKILRHLEIVIIPKQKAASSGLTL